MILVEKTSVAANNTTKTIMAAMSIVEELSLTLDEHKYTGSIRMLDESTAVSRTVYNKVKKSLSAEYLFDTSKFMTKNGKLIPSDMYDYFASISDFTMEEIRDKLIDYVTENKEVIDSAVHILLEKRGSDIHFWRLGVRHPGNASCEVTLYCLCKMFHKHVMVHKTGWYWTTVSHKLDESEKDIAAKCDINLVYLGGGRYAVATKLENKNVSNQTKSSSSISDMVKGAKPVTKGLDKQKPKPSAEPVSSSLSDSEPVRCTLRPRYCKRHTKRELCCTSEYINYSRYGTDSNTEEETAPTTNKKPRVSRWPSATRE